MKLALFDFDGTLTFKDSLSEFIKFAVGKPTYYFKITLFSPIYLLYKTKLMDNSFAKELLMKLFFYGMSENQFKKYARDYSDNELDSIIRQEMHEKLLRHIKNGDRVIIISASMKCWLEPWTSKRDIELLCTELLFIDGRVKGAFANSNCHGEEKLRRIKKLLTLSDYEKIYAYGDSNGDDAMLSVADIKVKL